MKYYYVEEFINNSQHEINFNPTEEIVENYSECNMISLNRKPRKYWPKEIKAKPEIVLTIRTMLVEKGEYSNCPELIITEHDFNGTMMWKTIVTAGKYNKRKSKCIKNLIKKFHERIKNSTIGVCSNKRIICEVCEQKKTDSKD